MLAWEARRLASYDGAGTGGCSRGMLRAVSNTGDPAWLLNGTRLRANRYRRGVVEMKLSRPGTAQLFWRTFSDSSASEVASISVPIAGDGQFHTCVFEIGKNDQWAGCITSLRFDPATEPGVAVEIRTIRSERGAEGLFAGLGEGAPWV
ncbi:MAG: hypothetical protein NT154_22420 [Verrucomicrobia bacterium]|nr:hypothetical protein [Verrucomicrobiota bacterium]